MIARSARSIALAEKSATTEIAAGLMSVRQIAVEDLELLANDEPCALAFAIRVGALDGRHPNAGEIAPPDR